MNWGRTLHHRDHDRPPQQGTTVRAFMQGLFYPRPRKPGKENILKPRPVHDRLFIVGEPHMPGDCMFSGKPEMNNMPAPDISNDPPRDCPFSPGGGYLFSGLKPGIILMAFISALCMASCCGKGESNMERLRGLMVKNQIEERGVTDQRVLHAEDRRTAFVHSLTRNQRSV